MSDNCPYVHLGELLRMEPGCPHCLTGFWCPFHGENPELDDIDEVTENAFLRSANATLQAENDRLREVQSAAKAYVKIRDTIEQKDLRNITDLYAFGRLKIVLKDSYK